MFESGFHLSFIRVRSILGSAAAKTDSGETVSTVARADPYLMAFEILLVKDAHLLYCMTGIVNLVMEIPNIVSTT